MFFLGILLAVAALQEAHVLSGLAHELNGSISNPFVMTSLIGVISSIIDNVPLVSACIKMFSDASFVSSSSIYLQDGLFWHLLTYASGVGGSLLVIGSAAGVVAMGLEKISFFWYVKRITLLAFSGYIAGILVIWLEHSVLSFF